MQEFELPQLPAGYRFGAEMSVPFNGKGHFEAPNGTVIKKIDTENNVVICVPFQHYIKDQDMWVTLSTKS